MMYDLAIIGGGPAGYSAAFEAIKYGFSIIMFEKELLGGTCLNRGCIPTKFLARSAELFSKSKDSEEYGIISENIMLDFSKTSAQMQNTISCLRNNLVGLLQQNRIEIVNGYAAVTGLNSIVCNDISYEAKNIIIATGSVYESPIVPEALSGDDVLMLNRIPQRVKIIGGGVVAIEFAYIFNQFGSDVTICIRGERILKKWDKELAISVSQNLKRQGIKIVPKCEEQVFSDGEYDFIMSATGRRPFYNNDNFSIALDEKGAIIVDQNGRTSQPNVYAAGDVISGSSMLAHIAMEQGRNVVRHIAGKEVSRSVIASCIYLSPEVATVGLNEAEAKDLGIDVVTGKVNMASNAMTQICTDKRCFIKIVAERSTHQIIGAQLLCERASDISSEFVVAINNNLTVEEFIKSVHPHPSFSEAIQDALSAIEEKLNEI